MDSVPAGMDLDLASEQEKEKRGLKRIFNVDAPTTALISVYFRAALDPQIRSPKETIHWYTFPLRPDPNPNPQTEEEETEEEESDDEFVVKDTDNTQLELFSNTPLEPFSKTNECVYSVAVGLGSSIFVLGANTDDTFPGLNPKVDRIPSTRVSVFDRAESNPHWKEARSMLRPRVDFCAVVQDGKIFVMSGLNYETRPEILDAYFVEFYDPSIGRWQL